MKSVKPFGDLRTATILVIGQDPRLQRSHAEAEVAFFFDYLAHSRPASRSEARRYDLAQAVWRYVNDLTGCDVLLTELYVTNLCNEFLEHAPRSGTVLIPDEQARRGVEEIKQIVAGGRFKVILPMAVQTFYHLCRLGFISEASELADFIQAACPHPDKAAQGIYQQSGQAPFLEVCGQRFHHRGVPVIPIVHVKQWPLRPGMIRYEEPMQQARQQVQAAYRGES
jgi:hypothetical protein